MKFWRCRCALVIAALLWVVPASAQDRVDPDEDTASAVTDEPAGLTDPERDFEEPDSDPSAANLEEPDSDPPESDLQGPDSEKPEEVHPADEPQKTSDIEKILVTGEKQSTLQDAPTSSTSFTSGDLQALRIENISDLADYTPNLEINTSFAASNPTIFIRGIGLKDYNANAAGAVAVYQDGININSPAIQLGQLFDIDGIDVLRGPQGSVNGRNATAGAILIRSAMPDGEFGVSTSLTYGNYDNKEVEAAINIPLVKDMLSMRVSGTARWRDGYTKNQCAGWNPEALGFRRVDQQTNEELFAALLPAGQYENGVLRPALIQRENGTGQSSAFVYLNSELAREARQFAAPITPGPPQNPFVLREDLFDENGVKIASLGDDVAKQGTVLRIDDVDGICMIRPPGEIATTQGDFGDPRPIWDEGTWQPSRSQPGLEEFAGLKRWTNNIENWAARMVLLFEPLDNMEWMVNAHGRQNRGDSAHQQMLGAVVKPTSLGFNERPVEGFSDNAAVNIAREAGVGDLGEGIRNVRGIDPDNLPGEGGGNPYSGFYGEDGTEFIDAWGVNGRGFWDLGAAVITLLYDYEWFDRVVENEGDANPRRIFPSIWSDSAWQTTEELRIEGEGERYTWTTGFFFLHEELNATNFFPDVRQFQIKQRFDQTLTSWAPYAHGEVDLVEEGVIPGIYELTLGAGLRYNQEKKEFSLVSSAIGSTSGIEVIELPEDTRERTWKEWTGEVQLSYTPFFNEYGTLRSYLKYGRGFKGGHFNASLEITGGDPEQDIDPVEPEFIDAIEFGIRSRWFDDRVIFNAAVFRYWYQDLQVFDITNDEAELPLVRLLNGDADVLGAEAELRVRPVPGLLISGNLGWLDSEFKEFVVRKTAGRGQGRGIDFDYAGNPLVAAPTWNWAVIVNYEAPLFGWGWLIPQWDFNYRSKAYLDPQKLDPISQDGYWLHNARIAYRTPDSQIELAFWVSNVFDEEYKVDVFDITREHGTIMEAWGKPRTYGVTLSLNW